MQSLKRRFEEIKVAVVLRAARTGLGLSQAELARELDVSQSAITRFERGTGTVPSNVLFRAIAFFKDQGIDISGIFEKDPVISFREDVFQDMHTETKTRKNKAVDTPDESEPTASEAPSSKLGN